MAAIICLLALAGCKRGERPAAKTYEIERRYSNGPATLILKLSRQQITVADTVELALEAHAPEGQTIQLPSFSGKLGEFTVSGSDRSSPRLVENGRVIVSGTYELEPFLPGDYEAPPITVRFGDSVTIETARETIKVGSVLPRGEKPEIREIGPPSSCPDSAAGFISSWGSRRRRSHMRSRFCGSGGKRLARRNRRCLRTKWRWRNSAS